MDASFSTWGGRVVGPLPASLPSDLPFKALMGWDGVILWGDSVHLVDMAREYAARAEAESCGQCFPCRLGTAEMAEILERICSGHGAEGDLERLQGVARYVMDSARCDIGQTAPRPLLDALEHFRDRFAAAIRGRTPIPRGTYVAQVTAPCMSACPARVDAPGYVEKIRLDRCSDSLALVRETCCMPGTIGRVCVRYCELKCRRGALDEPISIKLLKRHVADRELEAGVQAARREPARPATVAVVGAGPAGLSCAYYLGLKGYATTIFEALPEPGGMAAVGIPDYRLPRAVLRGEASLVEAAGAEIRYNVKVGEDVTIPQLFEQGYRAVFVGAGAPNASAMGCEGEDAGYEGFLPGVDFLRRVAFGEKPLEGKKILVVGGGNVAMDCVRSALRLGFSDVNLLYRRTEAEMPADPVEVTEAKEEGVNFQTLVAPVKIHALEGRVTGLECVRMTLGEPDASGRRRPVPEEGSNFVIECDAVVPAIGQACEVHRFASDGVRTNRNGTLIVDPLTLSSDEPRVFGGGDCVTGPSTLVAALAAGRRAAQSIAKYLETGDCAADARDHLDRAVAALSQASVEEAPPFAGRASRLHPPVVEPETRIRDFSEVEGGFSASQARQEANRCLRCYRIALAAG